MDIVFVERIFPLYRKAVYDAIYKKRGFVFFHSVSKKSGIRQTKAEYSSIISSIYYGGKDSRIFLFLLRKLLREKPRIIIHEFSAGIISIPLLLIYCRVMRTKLIFWGHMYDRSEGFFPAKKILDKYRLWLWKKADSLITYSEAEKQLLIGNKIPTEKIFVAFNTVDTTSFLKVRDQLEEIGRAAIKKRVKFDHDFNLTFIGRLYKEKKPDLLLDLLIGLKEKGFTSVAVHYIGTGELMPLLKKMTKELQLTFDVFFHGAIYDEVKTGELLFCSDLMIMPGCVGLSVNHAFCFNCPVVTFKEINLNPAHGPEIEYIHNHKTGFIIPQHSTEALVTIVAEYLKSKDLRMAIQSEVRNFIENKCSVEKMAEGVSDAINYTFKNIN